MKLEKKDIVEHKGRLYEMVTWAGDAEAKRGTRIFCARLGTGAWELLPVAGLRLRCADNDPLLGTSKAPGRAINAKATNSSRAVTKPAKPLRQGAANKAPARCALLGRRP